MGSRRRLLKEEGIALEPKLVIEGREYPLPDLSDPTLGDAQTLRRYTDKTLEQLEQLRPDDPTLIAALCHIAIARDNPRASFDEIRDRVDKVHIAKIDLRGGDVLEEAVADLPLTNDESATGSQSSELGGGISSGGSSSNGSDGPQVTSLLATGSER